MTFLLLSVFGVAALAFSGAPNFYIAVILATIAAFTATAPTISGVSVNQTSVSDEIRGRATGLYGTLYGAAPTDGATSMGWASNFVGLRWPIAIGATVYLVWWLAAKLSNHASKPARKVATSRQRDCILKRPRRLRPAMEHPLSSLGRSPPYAADAQRRSVRPRGATAGLHPHTSPPPYPESCSAPR